MSNAAINMITSAERHQVATTGFEPSVCAREDSMCAVVVDVPDPVVVSDASRDARYADNPLHASDAGTHLTLTVSDEGRRRLDSGVVHGAATAAGAAGRAGGLDTAAELAEALGGHLSLDASRLSSFVLRVPKRA